MKKLTMILATLAVTSILGCAPPPPPKVPVIVPPGAPEPPVVPPGHEVIKPGE